MYIGITGQGYSFDFMIPIREMGYEPWTIYNGEELNDVEKLAGLIIPGGPDVDTTLYGVKPHPNMRLSPPDRERDTIELNLITLCLSLGIPILSVCRGHQIMAVSQGMSLIPNISGSHPFLNSTRGPHGNPYHRIEEVVTPWEGEFEDRVNTYHHQAVPYIPDRLEECGITTHFVADHEIQGDNGIVECMSGPGFFSVQWHPEYDYTTSRISRQVFTKFQEMVGEAAS